MSLILKNTTGSVKVWGGIQIEAASQYAIQEVDRLRLLSDTLFLTDLTGLSAVVNDGATNLSAADAALVLKLDASEGRFLKTGTNFLSNDIRSAINEAVSVMVSGRIIMVESMRTSSLSNQWMRRHENALTMDVAPLILPFAAKLIGLTFVNDASSSSINVELYKNGKESGNLVYTWPVSLKKHAYLFDMNLVNTTPALQFSPGDQFGIFGRRTSLINPSKSMITAFFYVTSETAGVGGSVT